MRDCYGVQESAFHKGLNGLKGSHKWRHSRLGRAHLRSDTKLYGYPRTAKELK